MMNKEEKESLKKQRNLYIDCKYSEARLEAENGCLKHELVTMRALVSHLTSKPIKEIVDSNGNISNREEWHSVNLNHGDRRC